MSAIAEATQLEWLNRRTYPFAPHYLQVEGGRMHYVDEGTGEPILFVHGTPTWSYLFRNVIRELSAEGYRCVAPDNIGFGLSEKPQSFSHSPAAHARNLGKLVDSLDLRDVTLVVHDFGGPIGMGYAIEHLNRFKRIILLNSWFCDVSKEPAIQKLSKAASGPLGKFLYLTSCAGPKAIKPLFVDREKYTEEINKAYFGPFLRKEDRHATLAFAQHFLDSSAWMAEIWAQREALNTLPLMMIWGLKDPVFGEKALNKIWHEFPLSEVQAFPDAGHFLIEERPREVLSTLRGFLKQPIRTTGYLA